MALCSLINWQATHEQLCRETTDEILLRNEEENVPIRVQLESWFRHEYYLQRYWTVWCLRLVPRFLLNEWRKRALPCCCFSACQTSLSLSLSSSGVSGSSWGGPALAPLKKGRSATHCASASTDPHPLSPPVHTPSLLLGDGKENFQSRCGSEC